MTQELLYWQALIGALHPEMAADASASPRLGRRPLWWQLQGDRKGPSVKFGEMPVVTPHL